MCCEKTGDVHGVRGDAVPQRSSAAFEQENEDMFKPDARMLCPICLHPYKLVGFMYKHMQKVHPESFKLIAEMLGADEETLDGQAHDDQLPMLCTNKTPVNFPEGTSDEQESFALPSSASDKENAVPDESQASSSREQRVDNVPSLSKAYSKKFVAKKKGLTSSALKSHKENLSPLNQGNKNVSPEVFPQSSRSQDSFKAASADGCHSPRLKRAKTDRVIRVKPTDKKNVEGEIPHEAFPPKKLLEQFRFLYLKGLYNMWLGCANQQNHGDSNVSKNGEDDRQGPGFWEILNVEAVYIDPFLVDNGITTIDLASGENGV